MSCTTNDMAVCSADERVDCWTASEWMWSLAHLSHNVLLIDAQSVCSSSIQDVQIATWTHPNRRFHRPSLQLRKTVLVFVEELRGSKVCLPGNTVRLWIQNLSTLAHVPNGGVPDLCQGKGSRSENHKQGHRSSVSPRCYSKWLCPVPQ
jgi:hypothetical protein